MAIKMHIIPTPLERAMGRIMRAPYHPENSGDEGDDDLDNEDEDGEDEDQSGQSDDEGDDADDQEGDDDGSDPSDDDKGSKRGAKGYEKRINRLTARLKALETENETLRKPEKRGSSEERKSERDLNAKPKITDFDVYEDYTEALIDWKADQKINAANEKRKEAEANADFEKRFSKGIKRYSDWDDVVTDDVQIKKSALTAIREADDPAGIVYYLAQNEDDLDKLNELPPSKQALYVGRLEAKLEKRSSSESNGSRKTSEAPPPVKKSRDSGGSVTKPYEKMSMSEYIAARKREIAKEQGR